MRHCVSLCFIVLFMFLYNIVSGKLALLLLINDDDDMGLYRFDWTIDPQAAVSLMLLNW